MLSSVLLFLNIGTPELMLILFAALLLFGGNKLPELARGLGKGIREFKDASEDVKREIHNQINNFDEKITEENAVQKEEQPVTSDDLGHNLNESAVVQDEIDPMPVATEKPDESVLTPPLSITTNADASVKTTDPSTKIKEENINH